MSLPANAAAHSAVVTEARGGDGAQSWWNTEMSRPKKGYDWKVTMFW